MLKIQGGESFLVMLVFPRSLLNLKKFQFVLFSLAFLNNHI